MSVLTLANTKRREREVGGQLNAVRQGKNDAAKGATPQEDTYRLTSTRYCPHHLIITLHRCK